MVAQARQVVQTSVGAAAAYVDGCALGHARGITIVLGHGAGRGSNCDDLVALAQALPTRGIAVVRIDQPWVVAGRKIAPRPQALDVAWVETIAELRERGLITDTLVVGGRSAGARVACRTASTVGADAVVAIAFPLTPPSTRPEDAQRRVELATASAGGSRPVLVVQGARDQFGGPPDFDDLDVGPLVIRGLPYADHSLRVPARAPVSSGEIHELLVEHVVEFSLALSDRR